MYVGPWTLGFAFGFWTLVFGIKVKVLAKAQRPWTLGDVGICILDLRFWILESGLWIFHFALWLSDFGILVFGLCALD